RKLGVNVTLYTKTISRQLSLDLERYNSQYEPITIKPFSQSHDRFLILDRSELYHIGASLKDLGKKWFAFSKMDLSTSKILEQLEEQ
ncbi:ORF6N domain-containing protein, partial [Glaesserella parasuis]|nr:ORF6N domain-containing protein [Glaesserella parasuis]